MPVRLIFRCEFCGRTPGPETHACLERQVQCLRHGEFVDAAPERWLTWHGRGIYGANRYACPDHRGDLSALVREHYGTVGWHPWRMGPYPERPRRPGTATVRKAARFGGRAGFGVG